MVKVVWFLRKAEHLSLEEFGKWWLEGHAPRHRLFGHGGARGRPERLRGIGEVTLVSSLAATAASVAAVVIVVFLVLLIYLVFMPRVRWPHLLAGSGLTTAALWLVMRPAFSLFLTYNPGFGLAFGSFKSLFIVIIWIYYSQAVFLFGAEITSALNRKDSILIKRLMEGRKMIPARGRSRFVTRFRAGLTIFRDGEPGSEMYYVLKWSVGIRAG